MKIIEILAISLSCFFILLTFLSIFNNWLPIWACNKLGWHLEPKSKNFDGVSLNGVCPRCNKKVLQDSQGNWFGIK